MFVKRRGRTHAIDFDHTIVLVTCFVFKWCAVSILWIIFPKSHIPPYYYSKSRNQPTLQIKSEIKLIPESTYKSNITILTYLLL